MIARQLPCVFGEPLAVLNAAVDALSPSLVLTVGQTGGRTGITVEHVAINVDDARIADNQGQQPVDVPIMVNGPAAWFSPLPVRAMVVTMRNAGIPASVSQTAGTLVCSHVVHGLPHKLRDVPAVKGGLVHVPYSPQQAAQRPGALSTATGTVRRVLEIAVTTALQVESDIAVTGDATH